MSTIKIDGQSQEGESLPVLALPWDEALDDSIGGEKRGKLDEKM